MKKLILTAIAISSISAGINVFAQATVHFDNNVGVTLRTHVYSGPGPLQGNGSSDTPPGTTVWGTGYKLIGTTGGLAANTTFAQRLGAPGYNQPESGLLPGQGITSFRTGANAGQVAPTIETFNNIAPNAAAATLEMVAWDNSSGLYPTWTQASVAWVAGLIMAGESGRWNQDALGGTQPAPNLINSTDPSQHLQSFSVYFIPEPTTAALVALGAAAMLIFRRRK